MLCEFLKIHINAILISFEFFKFKCTISFSNSTAFEKSVNKHFSFFKNIMTKTVVVREG